MANSVLVIAESGAGKSTAGRSLDPKETFWINVANKPLPFRGWKSMYTPVTNEDPTGGNLSKVSSPAGIIMMLDIISKKMPHIKNVIVDDWQYASAFEFFDKAQETGYNKFNIIGQNIAAMARKPIDMRDDLIVFFLTHSEETIDINGKRSIKAKTVGKMVDNALTLEGLFSIVLYGKVKQDEKTKELKYVFETKNDGKNTCKSPDGMFSEKDIPNDLQLVREAIIKYEQ